MIEETDNTIEHIMINYPDMMSGIVNYKAKTGPFHQYIILPEIMNYVSPIAWWYLRSDRLLTLIDQ